MPFYPFLREDSHLKQTTAKKGRTQKDTRIPTSLLEDLGDMDQLSLGMSVFFSRAMRHALLPTSESPRLGTVAQLALLRSRKDRKASEQLAQGTRPF